MKSVRVDRFGPPEVMRLIEEPTPEPGPGEARVRVTGIGMNHADLMAREGRYKILSGEPPFTPGIEAGGVIEALGPGVVERRIGQRVILGADVPRLRRFPHGGLDGTYRTHAVVPWELTLPAPDAIPDDQLGAIWLPFLTAWGCLVWKQNLQPGQFVGIPAASSSVGMAAAQVAKRQGARPIGLTGSPSKVDPLRDMPESDFERIVLTRGEDGAALPWHREIKAITGGRGVDVFFDPVAAGAFLDTEIRCLAPYGTIWVYGLLERPGPVDVTPLIVTHGAIRGWVLTELVMADQEAMQRGYREILQAFEEGAYRQRVAAVYPLGEVRRAHEEMAKGAHIGKLVLAGDR